MASDSSDNEEIRKKNSTFDFSSLFDRKDYIEKLHLRYKDQLSRNEYYQHLPNQEYNGYENDIDWSKYNKESVH